MAREYTAAKAQNMPTKRQRRKRKTIIFLIIIICAGLCIAIFPYFRGQWTERQSMNDVQDFYDIVSVVTRDGKTPADDEGEIPYPELYEAMREYNTTLYDNGQIYLSDDNACAVPSFTLADWGVETECFGVVVIPSLDIVMPLYLGASDNNLSMGAAQLTETSIPIGGINTNAVIAGHCSWNGANYFRYLSNIQVGDYIYITNLWDTLVYQVTETDIIWPYESDRIMIQDGKDMVTLFTCHPFASGGKYRFLAYCERVYDPTQDVLDAMMEKQDEESGVWLWIKDVFKGFRRFVFRYED